jgi:hypothetical protein
MAETRLARAEFNRLETLEWGEKHFGSLATGRAFPRRVMLRLVSRGLVRSVGLVELCDDDGFTISPQRLGEGYVMTDAGRKALAMSRTPTAPPPPERS